MDIKIPDNYDDALKRKFELLDKINSYNEALFNGTELPYTEEEIDAFQEEYELLDDNLALSEKEKIQKLDKEDVVKLDDGTLVEKQSFFDKIHWSMYLYLACVVVFSIVSFFMMRALGDKMFTHSVYSYFEKVFDITNDEFTSLGPSSEYFLSPAKYWGGIGYYFIIPAVVIVVSVGVYLLYFKRHDLNTKIAMYVMIFNIVLCLVLTAVILFGTDLLDKYQIIYDNIDAVYYSYINQAYGGYGA